MLLATGLGDLTSDDDILGIAEHAAEGVTGQRAGLGFMPGHDHPRIESAGQRETDRFLGAEIAGQVSRKDVPEFLIVAFRIENRLLFPLARLEVRALSFE